jgi:peptidyl-prolyl cis-trans isomerase SurA
MRSRRLLVLALVALVAGGCAIPRWVPFLGSREGEPKSSPRRAAVAEKRKTGSKTPMRLPDEPGEDPAPEAAASAPGAPRRPAEVDDTVMDRVVAVVNNDAITLGELQESIVAFRHESRGRVSATDEQLGREFLTRLIDTRLQLQEADRERIAVEDAEITEELMGRLKRLGASSLEDLEAAVKAQGLTMEAVRRRVREGLRIAKVVRRKVSLRVSVTDREIDRYLGENRDKLEAGLSYHARHILIVPDGASDTAWEAARIRADMVRASVLDGADFAEQARQHSRDASAKDGGDLGTLQRGELAQDIESQILTLEAGEVSRPVRSALGFHVFKLESKEVLEGEALQRARQQVRDILFREKYEARLSAWLREIKERAVIEVRM